MRSKRYNDNWAIGYRSSLSVGINSPVKVRCVDYQFNVPSELHSAILH